MAPDNRLTILLVLGLVVLGVAAATMSAQTSEAEARQVFETVGCTNCHVEGGAAEPWDATLQKIRSWASKYDTLDEAVQAEYTFSGGAASFDELMAQMHQFTPTATDQDIQLLTDFFKAVFQEAKASATTTTPPPPPPTETTTTTTTTTPQQPGGTVTVTETVTETTTVTKTVTKTQTVPVTVETTITKVRVVTEKAAGLPEVGGYPLGVAVLVALVALAALFLLRVKL